MKIKEYSLKLTNDWSEARVDPLAALLIQRGGQTGKYHAGGRQRGLPVSRQQTIKRGSQQSR